MRRVLPLLVLMSLAFAPAPLPRAQRQPTVLAPSMEGVWQGHTRSRVTATHIIYHDNLPEGHRVPCPLRVERAANPPTYDVLGVYDGKTHYPGIYRIELRKYEGHTAPVVNVTFFPDGKRIASASHDGTARIWRAPR